MCFPQSSPLSFFTLPGDLIHSYVSIHSLHADDARTVSWHSYHLSYPSQCSVTRGQTNISIQERHSQQYLKCLKMSPITLLFTVCSSISTSELEEWCHPLLYSSDQKHGSPSRLQSFSHSQYSNCHCGGQYYYFFSPQIVTTPLTALIFKGFLPLQDLAFHGKNAFQLLALGFAV